MSLSTFWLSETSMLMFLKTLNKIFYVPFSCPKWMKLIKLSSLARIRTIQSKEQWITNLWYWYYLNPIILSFPSKPSLKYVFRLKAAWRVTVILFANDWQLLKSRLNYRALLYITEKYLFTTRYFYDSARDHEILTRLILSTQLRTMVGVRDCRHILEVEENSWSKIMFRVNPLKRES